MKQRDNEIRVRPGRIRDSGRGLSRPKSFVGLVMRAAEKAGHVGGSFGRGKGGASRFRFGRGRRAALSLSLRSTSRRVVMKARVVRHHGARFRSAPLSKHITYLRRDGVTRDGAEARMFDASSDTADERAFAERCRDDRHHFRFIISPEDAAELGDLRTFTRELMSDVTRDLGTKLDWFAVDHWNTDSPHIHVLIRGRTEDGQVEAERWTSLDRALRIAADEGAGVANLRPSASGEDPELRRLMLGRAARLERLGLAEQIATGCWTSNRALRIGCVISRFAATSSRRCIE